MFRFTTQERPFLSDPLLWAARLDRVLETGRTRSALAIMEEYSLVVRAALKPGRRRKHI